MDTKKWVIWLQSYLLHKGKSIAVLSNEDGDVKIQFKDKELNDLNAMMQKTQIILKKDYSMIVKVPLFHEVSIFIILKALGLVKDKALSFHREYDGISVTDADKIIISAALTNGTVFNVKTSDGTSEISQKFICRDDKKHEFHWSLPK